MNHAVLSFATADDADRFLAWMRTQDSEPFRGEWQIEDAT